MFLCHNGDRKNPFAELFMVIMNFDSKEEASLFHEHPGEVAFVAWAAQVNQLQTAESSNYLNGLYACFSVVCGL